MRQNEKCRDKKKLSKSLIQKTTRARTREVHNMWANIKRIIKKSDEKSQFISFSSWWDCVFRRHIDTSRTQDWKWMQLFIFYDHFLCDRIRLHETINVIAVIVVRFDWMNFRLFFCESKSVTRINLRSIFFFRENFPTKTARILTIEHNTIKWRNKIEFTLSKRILGAGPWWVRASHVKRHTRSHTESGISFFPLLNVF